MTAEPRGDLADRDAGLDQAEEGAALVEVEVAVGPGLRRLRVRGAKARAEMS
jgi:hypothetical protein